MKPGLSERTMKPLNRRDIRILVVDAHPTVADGTSRVLEEAGYTTATALSGEEALRWLTSFPADLVLSNRELPGLDGLEVCRRIKSHPAYSNVLVVLSSSTGTGSEQPAEVVDSGADGYLDQPMGNREFLARVEAFVRILRLSGALREQSAELEATVAGLRERERQLAALVSSVPGMVYRCANLPDWPMEFVSEGCAALTGWAPAALMKHTPSYGELILPADRQRIWDEVQAALATHAPFNLTYQIQARDGQSKWVWERGRGAFGDNGELRFLEGFITDITERKRAERELRDSETRFRALFDRAGYAMGMGKAGIQVVVNQAYLDLFGYRDASEVIGSPIIDHIAPGERPRLQEYARCRSRGEPAPSLYETQGLRRDGTTFDMEVRITTYEIEAETYTIGILRDITQRKQAETVLQESVREKESLLKEIHHRVKNNLQVISSLLRLQFGPIKNLETQAALKDMEGRLRSMALVHEHLYGGENLGSVDLDTYLKQLCTQLFHALVAPPRSVQLRLDLASVRLEIDQAVPCGLLVNELVSNAFKHAFPKGRAGEVRVELQPLPDGSAFRLRVADTGVGLPAAFDLQRLKSLGLGLVVTLTRQLQGKLRIGPGPGAEFVVVFTPKPAQDTV